MKYREITAQQLSEGYLVLDGVRTERREYRVVSKGKRDTYIVIDPESEEKSEQHD